MKKMFRSSVVSGVTLDKMVIFNLKADIEGKSDIISEVFTTLASAELMWILSFIILSSNTQMVLAFLLVKKNPEST